MPHGGDTSARTVAGRGRSCSLGGARQARRRHGPARRWALLLVTLSVAACGPRSDVLRVDLTPRPAQSPDAVVLLLDEPDRPYDSIALIEVANGWGSSLADLGRRMVREAARLGGDAVLITQRLASSEGRVVHVGDKEDSRLVGKVIVFRRGGAGRDP